VWRQSRWDWGNLQLTVKEPFLCRVEEGGVGAWQAIITAKEVPLLTFFSLLCFPTGEGKKNDSHGHASKPLKEL